MTKDQVNFRASDLTINQLADLQEYWGTTQTDAISECISRGWHDEAARRETGAPAIWRVQPGSRFFTTVDAARAWLSAQGAQRIEVGEWYSEQSETWYNLEQIRYEREEQMTIEQARQRVEDTELIYISNLIFSDWDNMEEHAWIVQADINEILDWARDLGYLIHLSGDIEQMQEQAWDGNVGQSVDDFMLDYDSIEDSVDDYLDQYEEMFQEPIPTYYSELTQSYYSLRELLVGYLKRMYV
jgi:hypothetical protein